MHRYFALFLFALSVLVTRTAVAGIATTTAVTSSNNPSTQGASVTLTATVTPSDAAAATVDFFDGATNIGNATPAAPGVYRITLTNLASGARSITATYNGPGGASHDPSTSAAFTQDVNATPSADAITVVSSNNPTTYGDSITFTATTSGGSAPLTVQFRDGNQNLGQPVAGTGATGNTFTFTTSALRAGNHDIRARFSNVTSAPVAQVVNKSNDRAASLASSKNPADFAESVTLTATVTTGSGEVPTGDVTFRDTYNGATTTLATANLSAGKATFTSTTLGTGSHNIVATYNGDNNYAAGANASVTQLVGAAGSATALTSSVNPSIVGQPLTLTAKVTTNSTSPIAGKITFADGGTQLGVVNVANGEAKLNVPSFTTAGTHALTATYGQDPNINGSTGNLSQVVSKAQSTVTLSSSSSAVGVGAPVTFSAVVKVTAPGSATPTGSVEFKDGNTSLGSVPVAASGLATFKTSTLGAGTHTISAAYSGDARINTSQATVSQVVSNTATTVAATSSPSPSKFGEAVTISATLTSASGTPTGSVTFKSGTTTLGVGALSTVGIATLTTSDLGAGTVTITVEYDGGGAFEPGSGSVIHIVEKGTATIELTSSPSPSETGASVTFTATIKPGKATGTIQIFDGETSLGTFNIVNSTGTFSTKDLAEGEHTIKVTYSGDENLNGANATATHTVKPPGAAGDDDDGSGKSSSGGGGATDDGCNVASGSSTSHILSFAGLALGLMLALRRRRR